MCLNQKGKYLHREKSQKEAERSSYLWVVESQDIILFPPLFMSIFQFQEVDLLSQPYITHTFLQPDGLILSLHDLSLLHTFADTDPPFSPRANFSLSISIKVSLDMLIFSHHFFFWTSVHSSVGGITCHLSRAQISSLNPQTSLGDFYYYIHFVDADTV